VANCRPRYVTLINPVVEKGVEIALAVARRLPHREFLFVESWPLFPYQRAFLESLVRGLRNVRRLRPTLDMRRVYRETAVLLEPSQWEEGFGRVALEAQVSSIPVIASAVGGIPEAVAGGGAVLLPSDADPALWADAVERVFGVPGEAERLGAAGLANLARSELDPERIVNCFEALAASHARRRQA
jgi:glycosyltransferase involved in cell wall biosynthesis